MDRNDDEVPIAWKEPENRDPANLNDHLKVTWYDIFAEPESLRSNDCTWLLAFRFFLCGKWFCYQTHTFLCGALIALLWGCQFGWLSFLHVWSVTPSLRIFAINCGCAQKLWTTCVQCLLAPVCELSGLCCSRIRIRRDTSEV